MSQESPTTYHITCTGEFRDSRLRTQQVDQIIHLLGSNMALTNGQ